jgi:hypothetical protein
MGRVAEHETVEQWRNIDVRRWAREGSLIAGTSFGWYWSVNGRSVASISIHVPDTNQVRLMYQLTRNGESRSYDYSVHLERTPCHFGGSRVWFLCPCCNRRTAKLYGPNSLFACRHCLQLNYACQRIAKRERWIERAWTLHRKAGSSFSPMDCASELIAKPKWMRWRSFKSIISRISFADARAQEELDRMFCLLSKKAKLQLE